jgi:hypothetical protein
VWDWLQITCRLCFMLYGAVHYCTCTDTTKYCYTCKKSNTHDTGVLIYSYFMFLELQETVIPSWRPYPAEYPTLITIKYEYVVGVSVQKDIWRCRSWGPYVFVTEMRNSSGSLWCETGAVNSEIKGPQIYQKLRNHLKITGASRAAWKKFCAENQKFSTGMWTSLLSGTFFLVFVNWVHVFIVRKENSCARGVGCHGARI